ncbi:MAG: GNAT family N-acetyltransferase [Clostridiales bacterium]|nr:GNAT family N-acetyltransferase [Clostridiales bacterium]MDD6936686.1 GNAT family N-acetyltransferase [Clostridiales bacterium]MDY2961431.1 GNAT family N-acetyltransferase [Oscillospiraceae bacterium]
MQTEVTLRLMTADEFERFRQRNLSRYMQELLLIGKTNVEAHALAEAQGALEEVLPQGLETPRNYIMAAENAAGETVGEVWCDTTEAETVFLNDFYVYEPHRRRGYGAAMIRAVEALAESQSFGQVMTHVFHTNKVAIAMFTKRGYAPFGGEADGSIFLRKVYFEVPQH